MDYHEQYRRYVAMIEETIEKILPQSRNGLPEQTCRNSQNSSVKRCDTACWRAAKRVRPVLAAGGMRYVGRRYSARRACLPRRWK